MGIPVVDALMKYKSSTDEGELHDDAGRRGTGY